MAPGSPGRCLVSSDHTTARTTQHQGDKVNTTDRACDACGAEAGEDCRPLCLGYAAHLDETVKLHDGWLYCLCGNAPGLGGWGACLPDGSGDSDELLSRGSDWQGHYLCGDCGRVTEPLPDSLVNGPVRVVGRVR
jgi:hypothetical protein